jgi:hypothetical protein
MTRKSKYNLDPYVLVKFPKDLFESLKKRFGKDWSENVRDIVADFVANQPEV